jgi:hypothetical protein
MIASSNRDVTLPSIDVRRVAHGMAEVLGQHVGVLADGPSLTVHQPVSARPRIFTCVRSRLWNIASARSRDAEQDVSIVFEACLARTAYESRYTYDSGGRLTDVQFPLETHQTPGGTPVLRRVAS